jgi:hypothetical protein
MLKQMHDWHIIARVNTDSRRLMDTFLSHYPELLAIETWDMEVDTKSWTAVSTISDVVNYPNKKEEKEEKKEKEKEEKEEKEDKNNECRCCMDNISDVTLKPCGHTCICDTCFKKMDVRHRKWKCLQCFAYVTGSVITIK